MRQPITLVSSTDSVKQINQKLKKIYMLNYCWTNKKGYLDMHNIIFKSSSLKKKNSSFPKKSSNSFTLLLSKQSIAKHCQVYKHSSLPQLMLTKCSFTFCLKSQQRSERFHQS